MAELTAVPRGLAPMLAVHADVPPGPGWSYEVKWDGHRALARVVGGVVAFAAWTTDGLLRQARWRGVRGG